MIVKGIVSAIKDGKASVILPEYNSVTTGFMPIYNRASNSGSLRVNDFVLVNFFNDDFNDGVIVDRGGEMPIYVTQETYNQLKADGKIVEGQMYMIVKEDV